MNYLPTSVLENQVARRATWLRGHTSVGHLLKPILELRATTMNHSQFLLRGLEKLQTERGLEYRLQESIVADVRNAGTHSPLATSER